MNKLIDRVAEVLPLWLIAKIIILLFFDEIGDRMFTRPPATLVIDMDKPNAYLKRD